MPSPALSAYCMFFCYSYSFDFTVFALRPNHQNRYSPADEGACLPLATRKHGQEACHRTHAEISRL